MTVQSGTASVAVTFTEGWAGFAMQANSAVTTSSYDAVRFFIHAGTANQQKGDSAGFSKTFVDGLIRGLRSSNAPVVGVEDTATQPSQIPWYIDHKIASVDGVDRLPGRASLVFALAGEADGHYGEKPTHDALLPDALVGRGG